MKQPVRITIEGGDYEEISKVLLDYVGFLKTKIKTPNARALGKRIVRYLARAKKKPTISASYIQQMRKDKNGEDDLCYLGVLLVDKEIVPISGLQQRNSSATAIKDAQAAGRRVKMRLDREWH